MKKSLTAILLFCLLSALLSCNGKSAPNERIRGKNRIELEDIKMKEFRDGEPVSELRASYLSLDRDSSELLASGGNLVYNIKSGKFSDRLDIGFIKGSYNLVSGKMHMLPKKGLLLENNISLFSGEIECNLTDGFVKAYETVRIGGSNFEFEGNGFSGNIREQTFVFDEGIKARIFR